MPFENNGTDSTNSTDYSGYGNNGTVVGATWNRTGGKVGGAYEFDGDDYIDIAKYIYSNIDGSSRELRVKNDRIQLDLYNIISFICIKNKKQKINKNNDTIDFRDRIFHEIRDDHFARLEKLRLIRNQLSH